MTAARTIADAARLVGYALRPRVRPARDLTYAELVRRYRADEEFATTVAAITSGLDLVILDADDRHGLVVAPTGDSVFTVRLSDYSKRTGESAADRVLHALAHLGAAALAFPRPADLANPAYTGRITADGVEAFVREAARRLAEKAAASDESADPPSDTPDLEAAWRAFTRRAATPGSGDGRRIASSTSGIVSKALIFLAEQGMLQRRGDDRGGTYQTTSRYRIHVLEAGNRMFGELLALGITEVTDGTGTLAITWTEGDLTPR